MGQAQRHRCTLTPLCVHTCAHTCSPMTDELKAMSIAFGEQNRERLALPTGMEMPQQGDKCPLLPPFRADMP